MLEVAGRNLNNLFILKAVNIKFLAVMQVIFMHLYVEIELLKVQIYLCLKEKSSII